MFVPFCTLRVLLKKRHLKGGGWREEQKKKSDEKKKTNFKCIFYHNIGHALSSYLVDLCDRFPHFVMA